MSFGRVLLAFLAFASISALQLPVLSRPASSLARTAGVSMMGRKGRPKMPDGPIASNSMQTARPPPEDGSSMFYLYCRADRPDIWYPVSAMNGDGQANGLIGAWLNAPLAKDVFKTRLDEGMAKSIFESERQLGEMAIRAHPSLAKYKTRLGWGYKMVSRDIAKKEASGGIEKQKVTPVFKDMVKEGWIDQAKKALGA